MKTLYRTVFEQTTLDIANQVIEYLNDSDEAPQTNKLPIGIDMKKAAQIILPHLTEEFCKAWMSMRYEQRLFAHEVGSNDDTADQDAFDLITKHLSQVI